MNYRIFKIGLLRTTLRSAFLTAMMAGALFNTCYRTEERPSFAYLEATKEIETQNGAAAASIYSRSDSSGARQVLLPPYVLTDSNGDRSVDEIRYAKDFAGAKLSQAQADSVFRAVVDY